MIDCPKDRKILARNKRERVTPTTFEAHAPSAALLFDDVYHLAAEMGGIASHAELTLNNALINGHTISKRLSRTASDASSFRPRPAFILITCRTSPMWHLCARRARFLPIPRKGTVSRSSSWKRSDSMFTRLGVGHPCRPHRLTHCRQADH